MIERTLLREIQDCNCQKKGWNLLDHYSSQELKKEVYYRTQHSLVETLAFLIFVRNYLKPEDRQESETTDHIGKSIAAYIGKEIEGKTVTSTDYQGYPEAIQREMKKVPRRLARDLIFPSSSFMALVSRVEDLLKYTPASIWQNDLRDEERVERFSAWNHQGAAERLRQFYNEKGIPTSDGEAQAFSHWLKDLEGEKNMTEVFEKWRGKDCEAGAWSELSAFSYWNKLDAKIRTGVFSEWTRVTPTEKGLIQQIIQYRTNHFVPKEAEEAIVTRIGELIETGELSAARCVELCRTMPFFSIRNIVGYSVGYKEEILP